MTAYVRSKIQCDESLILDMPGAECQRARRVEPCGSRTVKNSPWMPANACWAPSRDRLVLHSRTHVVTKYAVEHSVWSPSFPHLWKTLWKIGCGRDDHPGRASLMAFQQGTARQGPKNRHHEVGA